MLTVPGKDSILGVTIVGEHAGDLIAEYVLAMKHGLGLNKILGTIHIYPTLAEANKYAAGDWKRAHAPERAAGMGASAFMHGGAAEAGMRLSIVIPVLNEAANIEAMLSRLAGLRVDGAQLIVVDGGSEDDTRGARRCPMPTCVLASARGRALQMHAGALAADGDALLFLHADTVLPAACRRTGRSGACHACMGPLRRGAGRRAPGLPAHCGNDEPALAADSIATGDQAMFMRRAFYFEAGGYPPLALMEDIAFCKRARQLDRPACLRERVLTSGAALGKTRRLAHDIPDVAASAGLLPRRRPGERWRCAMAIGRRHEQTPCRHLHPRPGGRRDQDPADPAAGARRARRMCKEK